VDTTGFAGVTVSYIGDRVGQFRRVPQRQIWPGYAQTNFRVGVRRNGWTFNAFIDNAFDRRGLLNGGLGTFIPQVFNYIQPRTIGLTVSKQY